MVQPVVVGKPTGGPDIRGDMANDIALCRHPVGQMRPRKAVVSVFETAPQKKGHEAKPRRADIYRADRFQADLWD